MSSDTFYITLLSIAGDTAELLCATSTAGGYNDYAITRSFALMALEDGMAYGAKTPLQQGIAAGGGEIWEAKFHQENVAKFIARTELVERIGIILDEPAWMDGRFDEEPGADVERDFPLHKFILRVTVTDPKYLEGLTVGERWGTTAFDAWWDDPLRPSKKELAAVDKAATYWTPAARKPRAAAKKAAPKKTAAKKAPAKKAAKKAAPKKTAAKKTPAKKAAKKAAPKKTAAKKAPAKKAAKKAAPKKTAAKKTPAKKTAKAAATKKTAAKKTTAKKTAAKQSPAEKSAKKTQAKKSPARKTAKK